MEPIVLQTRIGGAFPSRRHAPTEQLHRLYGLPPPTMCMEHFNNLGDTRGTSSTFAATGGLLLSPPTPLPPTPASLRALRRDVERERFKLEVPVAPYPFCGRPVDLSSHYYEEPADKTALHIHSDGRFTYSHTDAVEPEDEGARRTTTYEGFFDKFGGGCVEAMEKHKDTVYDNFTEAWARARAVFRHTKEVRHIGEEGRLISTERGPFYFVVKIFPYYSPSRPMEKELQKVDAHISEAATANSAGNWLDELPAVPEPTVAEVTAYDIQDFPERKKYSRLNKPTNPLPGMKKDESFGKTISPKNRGGVKGWAASTSCLRKSLSSPGLTASCSVSGHRATNRFQWSDTRERIR